MPLVALSFRILGRLGPRARCLSCLCGAQDEAAAIIWAKGKGKRPASTSSSRRHYALQRLAGGLQRRAARAAAAAGSDVRGPLAVAAEQTKKQLEQWLASGSPLQVGAGRKESDGSGGRGGGGGGCGGWAF